MAKKKKNEKKKKIRLMDVIFILLFLSGLGFLLYPTANDMYTQWQISKEISKYNEVAEGMKENYDEMWAEAEEYNRYLLTKEVQFWTTEEEEEWVDGLLNPVGNKMIGRIDIPCIQVDLPIYKGTEEEELQSGAGYWLGSSLPTGGESTHCILTAHTGLVKAKMFTDIDKLKTGDHFNIHVLDRDMTYEVDYITITEPEDMSNLLVQKGKDYVTLYTCYPYGVNTHRLLVRGKRIYLTPEEEKVEIIKNAYHWILPYLSLAGILIIFILLFLLFHRQVEYRMKKKKEQRKNKQK